MLGNLWDQLAEARNFERISKFNVGILKKIPGNEVAMVFETLKIAKIPKLVNSSPTRI